MNENIFYFLDKMLDLRSQDGRLGQNWLAVEQCIVAVVTPFPPFIL